MSDKPYDHIDPLPAKLMNVLARFAPEIGPEKATALTRELVLTFADHLEDKGQAEYDEFGPGIGTRLAWKAYRDIAHRTRRELDRGE